MGDKKGFPFKTLIWAVAALIIVFLFRSQLGEIISKSSTIEVFGVRIDVSEQEVDKLLEAQKEYESQIAKFNSDLEEQDRTIASLNGLIENLKSSTQDCEDAKDLALSLDRHYVQLQSQNQRIVEESAQFKNLKAIKTTKIEQ